MTAQGLISGSECTSCGADYSRLVAEQVVCCQAEGQVLYPHRFWHPKNDFFFFFSFGCSGRTMGFLSFPLGAQNWGTLRSCAPLMLHPGQNKITGRCPRGAVAALPFTTAVVVGDEDCVACPPFSLLHIASSAQHPSKYIFIKCKR